VESGDLVTFVVGIAIVVLVAVLANPQALSGLQPSPTVTPTPIMLTPVPTPVPVPVTATPAPVVATPTPQPTIAPPYRIYYTDNPLSYPSFTLPADMTPFGASDVYLEGGPMVTFAYFVDNRTGLTHSGGLSQKFSIPYPIVIINATVTASAQNPQYGDFRMVLCYATNGTVITGMEILNQGSEIRVAQAANTDLYMIISTTYIDGYQIDLMTPKRYYDTYTKR